MRPSNTLGVNGLVREEATPWGDVCAFPEAAQTVETENAASQTKECLSFQTGKLYTRVLVALFIVMQS